MDILFLALLFYDVTFWANVLSASLPLRFSKTVKAAEHVNMGDEVKLRCNALGFPDPHYHWYKRHGGSLKMLNASSTRKFHHTGYMRITRVEPIDQGHYSCIAWNQNGRIHRNFTVVIDNDEESPNVAVDGEITNIKVEISDEIDSSAEISTTKSLDSTIDNFLADVQLVNATIYAKEKSNIFMTMLFSSTFTFMVVLIVFVSVALYCYNSRKKDMQQPRQYNSFARMCRMRRKTASVRSNATMHSYLRSDSVKTEDDAAQEDFHFRVDSVVGISILLSDFTNTDSKYKIDSSKVAVRDTPTMEGEFGRYVLATMTGVEDVGMKVVAVKRVQIADSAKSQILLLMAEAKTLIEIGDHANVINFVGHFVQNGSLCIAVEHCEGGTLSSFLRRHRPAVPDLSTYENVNCPRLTVQDLVRYAYQIARGMNYLAGKMLVHRNLCTSNVFVTKHDILKIGNFGLCRVIPKVKPYYRKQSDFLLPRRWMAPEALKSRRFTTKTDVWSFGVVIWELLTLGGRPYASVPVDSLENYLTQGYRLVRPHLCPDEMFDLMMNCWNLNSEKRWTFDVIEKYLDDIIAVGINQEYASEMPTVRNLSPIDEICAIDDSDGSID